MTRVAIITGASSGIGRATAYSLASDGYALTLAARRTDRLQSLAEELEDDYDVSAVPVETDVRKEPEVNRLIDRTLESFDRIDVLVNNAGVGRGGEIESMTTEDYRTMMGTNVDGVFYATRAALPHVITSRGNLVFVGSFAGHYPRPFNPIYAASKWWVRGFAHSLAAQIGQHGVAVSVINPSEVRTEFPADETAGEDVNTFKDVFEPGEVTSPTEVAEAIQYAVSVDSSGVAEIDLYRRDKFSDVF